MQQQQHGSSGANAQDGLSAFIHSTVTVHSLITDRIDKLQPGEQLTLKVLKSAPSCSSIMHAPVLVQSLQRIEA